MGQISSLSDSSGTIQSYSYLGLNTPLGETDGNGVTETTTLDSFGRVGGISYANSSTSLAQREYAELEKSLLQKR
jgi:hypothetical protein